MPRKERCSVAFDPTKKIRPFRHNLYVQTFDLPEQKTAAGVVIPKRAYNREIETSVRAKVIAVGTDCDPIFQVGTWVLIPKHQGTLIDKELRYWVITENCVIGILDEATTLHELGLKS